MSTMITEVYNAFKKAGVPDKEAQEAAQALLKESGDIKNDISVIKKDIHELNKGVYEIKADMKLTRYMLGLIIAILVIPFLKNFVS